VTRRSGAGVPICRELEGVPDVPEVGDASFLVVAEKVHVRDVDPRAADRQPTHRPEVERTLVGTGHRRAASDDVALAEHFVELEVQIRKCGAQRGDDLLEVPCHVSALGLLVVDRADGDGSVDVLEIAAVEDALEPFAGPALEIALSHARRPR
jgi:hypothetical protein